MTRTLAIIVLAVASSLLHGTAALSTPLEEKQSLQGLKGIGVLVAELPPHVRHVTREQLATDVELRLRVAGVSVVEEFSSNPGAPHLYVSVNMTPLPQDSLRDWYMASILLQLRQEVHLARTSHRLYASTWDTTLLVAGEANYVRESLRHMVDGFLNDYLEVNRR